MTKKFFKNKGALTVFVAVLITFLACWFADRHNDWNLDMMVKEISAVFIVLVSAGILPFAMPRNRKKKDSDEDKEE